MNAEPVITALGDNYTPDEEAIIKQILHEHHGTIPDNQLLEEIGLALGIHRRLRNRG